MIYMNEIDPYCAQWLQNLMDAGVLPPGHIDTRSIEDVTPNDLAGYTQCHFFAGLGGWIYALDLAGWPRDRPVWTGSCPCQPFSAAGKGAGFADERHLWPAWQHLIAQRKPATVFGEQVASKNADPWIDLVHADMEGMGYAFGCVPFPSAGVGAPHIRDRNYWVANANNSGRIGWWPSQAGDGRDSTRQQSERFCDAGGVADTKHDGCSGSQGNTPQPYSNGTHLGLSDRGHFAPQGQPATSPLNGFWRDADWLLCRDGKWRPVEPGTFPLAHGITNRVGRLRAYGNAICAEAAVEFIKVAMDYRP